MKHLPILFSAFSLVFSSCVFASEGGLDKSPPYPVADELIPGFSINQFKRHFPNEEELRAVDPKDIVEKLPDKTLTVYVSSVEVTESEGVVRHRGYNGQMHLYYLQADGRARRYFGKDDVRAGTWFIADNKLIVFYFKSRDPDGATRIVNRSYPLARFLRAIRHSKDGDYCQIEDGSTHAIVSYSNGGFSSRLNEACGRRR
jgi:hypothetical protein